MLSLLAPFLLIRLLDAARPRRSELLLRVIGLRPDTGLVHRPIVEADDDDAARFEREHARESERDRGAARC